MRSRPNLTASRSTQIQCLFLAAVLIASVFALLLAPSVAHASPGQPDRDQHPYVGMLVVDFGDGFVSPYCHATLISPTEAVTAHHCAPSGSVVSFTFDNPVVFPAEVHTGTVRLGGFDYWDYDVDVAIIDLHEPVELPRYAQLPSEPLVYEPGDIVDFVTYIATKRSSQHWPQAPAPVFAVPDAKYMQREPAHVDYDRNLTRTTTKQGNGEYDTEKVINTVNATCFGNSGSPIFPTRSDVIAGVLSMSFGSNAGFCIGGGNSGFSRTDSDLAMGILTGTAPPPPAEPPPDTVYPALVRGSSTSGTLSFDATIRAGHEYTGVVTGLAPANETPDVVAQDEFAVSPVSVKRSSDWFIAALADDYTSGADDLDIYLVWYVEGEPFLLAGSVEWYTSNDAVAFNIQDLKDLPWLDDPYNFEVWVHGWFTEGGSSTFALFTTELTGRGYVGDPIVDPVTAGPGDPNVTIDVTWSGLDPTNHMYLGRTAHYLDGYRQYAARDTILAIDIPQ